MSKNSLPSDFNKKLWESNLVRFEKAKNSRKYAKIVDSLDQINKMPTEQHILDRFKCLAANVKSRQERVVIVVKEVKILWKKLNLPIQKGKSTVERKIENVLNKYEKDSRKPGTQDFTNLFNVTDENGEWLCQEDKAFYNLQMSTNGKAGYCTTIEDTQRVHPRKLKLIKQKVSQDTKDDLSSEDEEHFNTEEEKQDSDSGSQDSEAPTWKRQKTDYAINLVTTAKLSSRKAHTVCKTLAKDGISIPTPSQSGVYKATMKAGEKLKEHFIETLRNENWSLHFDGKHIKNTEYQVVVLKNENREVKLAVLALINGKGETIFNGIKTVLDEYKLWPAIKLIISDTTSANTGKSVGAVTRLQNHFVKLGLDKPLYIGCQHHVLDTLLKHVMNDYFEAATTSPNLNYWFISRITEEYQQLKASFDNSGYALKEEEEIVWRDDMAFLHHLITCCRQFKKTGCFPKINFRTLPNISNARWNSRAIYALLAYILLPEFRQSAEGQSSCDFISGTWSDIWFSGQVYNQDNYNNLAAVCKDHSKAIKTLRTFWSVEPTPIPTQRSNICAERAIKVLQDLLPLCKSIEKINIKFLLTNEQH